MKTTSDRAGRIFTALVQVRLQRRGRLLVAVPRKKTQELAPESVERVRSILLHERSQSG